MERTRLINELRPVLVKVLGHEAFEMREDLTAADVKGWDSLTHMSIITAIEAHFNVKFKLRELNKLKNMGSLLDLISSNLDPA
jgi:acyl carrier protein